MERIMSVNIEYISWNVTQVICISPRYCGTKFSCHHELNKLLFSCGCRGENVKTLSSVWCQAFLCQRSASGNSRCCPPKNWRTFQQLRTMNDTKHVFILMLIRILKRRQTTLTDAWTVVSLIRPDNFHTQNLFFIDYKATPSPCRRIHLDESEVLTDISNTSLGQDVVPSHLKTSMITPVP